MYSCDDCSGRQEKNVSTPQKPDQVLPPGIVRAGVAQSKGGSGDRTFAGVESTSIEAVKNLWAAVMVQAVDDLHGRNQKVLSRQERLWRWEAKQWVMDSRTHCGSFIWVCRLFEVDPDRARKAMLDGSGFTRNLTWHIGRQLRAYRAHNNFDQIDMGRILGMSSTTVSNVERGRTIRTPAARRIRAFLKAKAWAS